MFYHFKIHKEGSGYWAECIELEGCYTQAETKNELADNMHEVLNLYLSEPEDTKIRFPEPKAAIKGKNIARVSVDPKIALSVRIKQARLRRHLTQKQASKLVFGKESLFTYQKLESPKTTNPEFATLIKIKKAFPEINLEDVVTDSA